MYTLQNDQYRLEILDPAEPNDAHHLGPRYIHGAYLWRWKDVACDENLISGPRYPDPNPPVFHGQGLPEVFRHNDKDSGELLMLSQDGNAMVPGVGWIKKIDDEFIVARPLDWQVHQSDISISFTAEDSLEDWSYRLTRCLHLEGHHLRSETIIENTGSATLPLEWYAHPFFTTESLNVTLEFGAPVTLPAQHQGFEGTGHELIMPSDKDWGDDGFFAWLESYPADASLLLRYQSSSFNMAYKGEQPIQRIALWGNQRTVSLEPYLKFELQPGTSTEWQLVFSHQNT